MRTIRRSLWAARSTRDFASDVERGYSYISRFLPVSPTELEAWLDAFTHYYYPPTPDFYPCLMSVVEARRSGALTEEAVEGFLGGLADRFRPIYPAPLGSGWVLARPGLGAFVAEEPDEAYDALRRDGRFPTTTVYIFRAAVVGADECWYREAARVQPLPGPAHGWDGTLVGRIVEVGACLRYRGE